MIRAVLLLLGIPKERAMAFSLGKTPILFGTSHYTYRRTALARMDAGTMEFVPKWISIVTGGYELALVGREATTPLRGALSLLRMFRIAGPREHS